MKNKFFTLLLIFSSGLIAAQIPLSLDQAIKRGLKNNYQINIDFNNQEIAKLNNTWGNVGALPTISLGANPILSQNNESAEFDKPNGTTTDTTNTTSRMNLGVNLNLNWTLFDGFRMFINKDKFNYLEDLSRGNTRFLVENTIETIVLAYNKVLLDKKKLEVYEKTTKLSKDRLDYEEAKKDLGTSTSFEFLQAKVSYLTDKTNELNQKQSYKSSLRDLTFVIGEKDSVFVPTGDLVAPKNEMNLGELMLKLKSDNINLRNQFLNIKIKEKDEELSYSSLYPTVRLTSQVGYGMNQTTFNDFELPVTTSLSYNVGLSINYNIFNGFTDENRIAIAKINKEVENIKLSKIEHELSNSLLKLYELFTLREELYTVSKSRTEATELNLELAKERFNRGAINSFNYRDVQLSYLNSAIAEYQAIYNLISSDVSIRKITGSIVAEKPEEGKASVE